MTIDEMIAVLQASKEGKAIETRTHVLRPNGRWVDVTGRSHWDFHTQDYRVKPEPKVIWVNEYDNSSAPRFNLWYPNKDDARFHAGECCRHVKYIEVVE